MCRHMVAHGLSYPTFHHITMSLNCLIHENCSNCCVLCVTHTSYRRPDVACRAAVKLAVRPGNHACHLHQDRGIASSTSLLLLVVTAAMVILLPHKVLVASACACILKHTEQSQAAGVRCPEQCCLSDVLETILTMHVRGLSASWQA